MGMADVVKRKRKRYEGYTFICTKSNFIKDLSSLLILFGLKP